MHFCLKSNSTVLQNVKGLFTVSICLLFLYAIQFITKITGSIHLSCQEMGMPKRGFSLIGAQVTTWQVPSPFTITLQEPSLSGAHWPRKPVLTVIQDVYLLSLPANNVSEHENIQNGSLYLRQFQVAFQNLSVYVSLIWYIILVDQYGLSHLF